jgi:hypothetical protein
MRHLAPLPSAKLDPRKTQLTLRWRGSLISKLDVALPRSNPPTARTSEDTIDLLRRLAVHYPDAVIAGILSRQGRKTFFGLPFTVSRVSSLRTHWKIPCFEPPQKPASGKCMTIANAAKTLGMFPSTLHRWINEGFVAGEQITPAAPWRIRVTDELRSRFVDKTPDGYVPMIDAVRILGVTRQTAIQRAKRGELQAVLATAALARA